MVASNYICEMRKPESAITIGHKIRAAIWQAQIESRLIIGLSAAVKSLSKTPDESLICIIAQPKVGDTSTHMLEVLLEAYCYENDIYIIKVDSVDKLGRILGARCNEPCVLIQKNIIGNSLGATNLTAVESDLVDFCEDIWDLPDAAAVILPWRDTPSTFFRENWIRVRNDSGHDWSQMCCSMVRGMRSTSNTFQTELRCVCVSRKMRITTRALYEQMLNTMYFKIISEGSRESGGRAREMKRNKIMVQKYIPLVLEFLPSFQSPLTFGLVWYVLYPETIPIEPVSATIVCTVRLRPHCYTSPTSTAFDGSFKRVHTTVRNVKAQPSGEFVFVSVCGEWSRRNAGVCFFRCTLFLNMSQ